MSGGLRRPCCCGRLEAHTARGPERTAAADQSRSNAARIAAVNARSSAVRNTPRWAPSAVVGTVTMLSQLTTLAWVRPFAGPIGTSVDRPLDVVVIGAT